MLYIEIDVHKKLCHAYIKDRNGSKLGELKFPNNISGLDKLLKAIDGRRAKAVLESTGNLWLRLYLGLEKAGVEVILSNPSKTKAIAEARLKNDRMDASTLADLLRAGLVGCIAITRPVLKRSSLVCLPTEAFSLWSGF